MGRDMGQQRWNLWALLPDSWQGVVLAQSGTRDLSEPIQQPLESRWSGRALSQRPPPGPIQEQRKREAGVHLGLHAQYGGRLRARDAWVPGSAVDAPLSP